ncbi:hypothetical protein Dimus_024849 [Dionaea muscipula]
MMSLESTEMGDESLESRVMRGSRSPGRSMEARCEWALKQLGLPSRCRSPSTRPDRVSRRLLSSDGSAASIEAAESTVTVLEMSIEGSATLIEGEGRSDAVEVPLTVSGEGASEDLSALGIHPGGPVKVFPRSGSHHVTVEAARQSSFGEVALTGYLPVAAAAARLSSIGGGVAVSGVGVAQAGSGLGQQSEASSQNRSFAFVT